jgi:integrase/recombinase XerD
MLLLIASYGLRGCEVRALRLNDIDWAHDEIVIFAPKTGRRRALPLTRPAGEAVLDYLLAERPRSRHRESSCPAVRRMARYGARSTPGWDASWTRRAS